MWQIILNGPRYFEATIFLPEGLTTLGRSSESDIVLGGTAVSRHHAQLEVKGEDLYVLDLGSRNGSQLNGQPLKGSALLKPGDVLTVGETTLTVRRPARVENAFADEVDPRAGGIRRIPAEGAPPPDLIGIRRLNVSHMLRSLEEYVPGEGELPEDSVPPAYRTLILLQETAEKVDSAAALQDFLDEVLDWAREKLGCSSGVVLLKHARGKLVPVALRRREGLAYGEVPVADAIVETCFHRRAAVAVSVGEDGARGGKGKGTVGGGDQVICAPIGPTEAFSGALYLARNGQSTDERDLLLDACNALAQLVGVAIERYQKEDRGRRGERLRKALERFHGPQILERQAQELARSGGSLTRMEKRRVTILCADITDFTSAVNALPPEHVVELLHEFYERMTGLVFSFEGTVDKFMGDSVLALFGAPYGREDDALRAVRCAQAMRAEWARAMNRRPPEERRGLQIGLNTGEALVGTVGSEARLDYTAIGEPVNLAIWLCGSAERGQIVLTRSTVELAGERFNALPLGERSFPKLKQPVPVFEILEEDESRQDTLQLKRA